MTIEKTKSGIYIITGNRQVEVWYHQHHPFIRVIVRVYGSVYCGDHATFDGEDALKNAIKFARGRARVRGSVVFH